MKNTILNFKYLLSGIFSLYFSASFAATNTIYEVNNISARILVNNQTHDTVLVPNSKQQFVFSDSLHNLCGSIGPVNNAKIPQQSQQWVLQSIGCNYQNDASASYINEWSPWVVNLVYAIENEQTKQIVGSCELNLDLQLLVNEYPSFSVLGYTFSTLSTSCTSPYTAASTVLNFNEYGDTGSLDYIFTITKSN